MDKIKFFSFLFIGLLLFSAWGTYNYATVVSSYETIQVESTDTKEFIQEQRHDIEQQKQSVVAYKDSLEVEGIVVDRVVDANLRIKELEREIAYLNSVERTELEDIESKSVLKTFTVDNPLVTGLLLPFLLYLIKLSLDFVFDYMRRRLIR